MGTPKPFAISLSCMHSPGPGMTWSAFVGFRPIRGGFSVWTSDPEYGDGDRHLRKISHGKGELSWRAACRSLMTPSNGSVFGELRRSVDVSGETGWRADLLAACWTREDEEVGDAVKEFLIGLSDDELEWLVASLQGHLFSGRSLDLIRRYAELESRPPRISWAAIEPTAAIPSFPEVVERVGQDADRRAEQAATERARALAPFAEGMRQLVDTIAPQHDAGNMWAGIAQRQRHVRLEWKIKEFVLEHLRLPNVDEAGRIWAAILTEPTRL